MMYLLITVDNYYIQNFKNSKVQKYWKNLRIEESNFYIL